MQKTLQAGVIGDYDPKYNNHLATTAALSHAAVALSQVINITWIPTDRIVKYDLSRFDLFWCAPGSPYTSADGAMEAIKYAREHNIPFIGTCGGFQYTILEFARNVLNISDATHAEEHPGSGTSFITPLQCSIEGQTLEIVLAEDTIASTSYKTHRISETYHCKYGLNPEYYEVLTKQGMIVSGTDNTNDVRIVELPTNDFFMATLFLPQSHSTEDKPHPLIMSLLSSAMQRQNVLSHCP
jgi:CTP synthase (UTP-ammonia lyase)